MTVLPIDEGMLTFYAELKAKSPPESVDWPLSDQRRAWDDVCRAFRAPRPGGLEVEDPFAGRGPGKRLVEHDDPNDPTDEHEGDFSRSC